MTYAAINGDLSQPAVVAAAAMAWQPSPSGSVWRKRFHLVGGAESGQVTSLVRYQPESRFPRHEHPDGEEILVLDGTFSDQQGDHPAGSYLLNPEGFSHAPFSRQGCLLFVKLRQYPGIQRPQVTRQTRSMQWQDRSDGSAVKELFADPGFPERMWLERWRAGTSAVRDCPGGAEIFVLSGEFKDQWGRHEQHTWLWLPPGARHDLRCPGGCELYIKFGGVRSLPCNLPAPPQAGR